MISLSCFEVAKALARLLFDGVTITHQLELNCVSTVPRDYIPPQSA
jgi:hypothetical protein